MSAGAQKAVDVRVLESNPSKMEDQFLVNVWTDKRSEQLVCDWANTLTEYPPVALALAKAEMPYPEEIKRAMARVDDSIGWLVKRYPEVFASFSPGPPPFEEKPESTVSTSDWWIVASVQRRLHLAWKASDARAREWHIFHARDEFHVKSAVQPVWEARLRASKDLKQAIEVGYTDKEQALRESVPHWTEFEQALFHLQKIENRMQLCHSPECDAPYFLALNRKQKYCAEKCAAVAQRQQKRDWWREKRSIPTPGGITKRRP
jgi:hypothetical protein